MRRLVPSPRRSQASWVPPCFSKMSKIIKAPFASGFLPTGEELFTSAGWKEGVPIVEGFGVGDVRRRFHQHFNTGFEPALQLALRCGSQKFPLGSRVAQIRAGVYTSVKQGGTLIEYADEDPEIRHAHLAELQKRDVVPDMNFDLAANRD
jgi:hypothetical protein